MTTSTRTRRRALAAIALAMTASALIAPLDAMGQAYPARAIKMVVPAGAGGPTDVMARVVAERLSASLGQPVVIDNKGGAGGAIGAKGVATSPADGYTLLFGNTATLATIPSVSRTAGYDVRKELVAVAKVTESYQVLVVDPALPVKTVPEFIAYAKAQAGKLNFGAVGVGNLTHLSGELLKNRIGIDFVTAHYKSGAEALNAILGGQVQFAIDNVSAVRGMVQAGRLRALAVTSTARQPDFADLPTMTEAGVPAGATMPKKLVTT